MMVFDTKSVEVSDVKWPTTTTGMRAWKSWGGLPGVGDVHDVGRPGRC